MIRASDWIAFHDDQTSDKLAAIDQPTGREFTYAHRNDRAAGLSAYLRDEWGIGGETILATNSTEIFEFQFAC